MPECGTSRCVGFFPFITHLGAVQIAAMPDPPAAPLVVRGVPCGKGSLHGFSLKTVEEAEQERRKQGNLLCEG